VEPSYIVCPVCTTRLRNACPGCGQPLESLWQVCPYCATDIPTTLPALEDVTTGKRRSTRRAQAADE
jgi:predicted amidophosphoribosyltransferase